MRERSRFQKRLYRFALRKEKRSSDQTDRRLIELALLDSTIFAMAYEQTMEDLMTLPTSAFGFSVSRNTDGTPIVDNLLKLLDWFVQNGPALIEIIRMIAHLFGGIVSAHSILGDGQHAEDSSNIGGDQ